MAKNMPKMNPDPQSGPALADAVRDAAQQIWLAGLGAFSKAQEQGSKAFEILVQEGLSLQHKTQTAAQEGIAQASSLMNVMAGDIQAQASDRVDKLQTIFEERVSKALGRLDTPTSAQMNALSARLDQLEKRIEQMGGASTATSQPASDSATGTKAVPRRQASTRKIATPAANKRAASTAAAKGTASSQLQAQSPAPGKRLKVSTSGS